LPETVKTAIRLLEYWWESSPPARAGDRETSVNVD